MAHLRSAMRGRAAGCRNIHRIRLPRKEQRRKAPAVPGFLSWRRRRCSPPEGLEWLPHEAATKVQLPQGLGSIRIEPIPVGRRLS